ncbi:BgTH12-07154 [Blumeria graminis f. sp. triticale]|uniref:Bgt-50405 n=2 Tax=Blumeria graminis TaxID=34373 RepID=A0A9X9MPB1_BLUGR|nr:BgTH12-07154 [Blumeria graminis f. sp. triticale]VDB94979.1 Bgt-50405 [Blumeria graminis f. sp. tritici]
MPWWLRPCYFPTRFAGQFSNHMIACSVAPALLQPGPKCDGNPELVMIMSI